MARAQVVRRVTGCYNRGVGGLGFMVESLRRSRTSVFLLLRLIGFQGGLLVQSPVEIAYVYARYLPLSISGL